jgi:choline dehydrogenase-like flavoprotein
VNIPARAGGAIGTNYDWNYTTVAMSSLNNRAVRIAQGKVIGGASVLNGMLFDRGAASDYDSWAELGNPGWDWAGLLPYFKKVLTYSHSQKLLFNYWIV